jgi:hypothetical protein
VESVPTAARRVPSFQPFSLLIAFCFTLGCVAAIFGTGETLVAQAAQTLKLEGDVEYFRPLRG